jgi:hypothetical protein
MRTGASCVTADIDPELPWSPRPPDEPRDERVPYHLQPFDAAVAAAHVALMRRFEREIEDSRK